MNTAPTRGVAIDLGDPVGFGQVRILAGEAIGIAARRHHGLDTLDRAAGPIRMVVPPDVVKLTASFVVGLLQPSVGRYGDIEALRSHYHFSADRDLLTEIDRGLAIALEREASKPKADRSAGWRDRLLRWLA